MNYQNEINANYYLARFNEILYNMSNEMRITTTTNNITIDFIRCMIPHHIAAIYMCENLLNYTYYRPLIDIANTIITIQKNEIETMQKIGDTTIPYANIEKQVNNYFKKYFKIVQNMVNEMRNSKTTIDINLDFIYEMIPHHEGAIKMCQNLLKYPIDPRLRMLANNIIVQENESIKILKQVQYNLNKNAFKY